METVVVGARGSRLAQAMVAEFLARLGGPSCGDDQLLRTLADVLALPPEVFASAARRHDWGAYPVHPAVKP